MLGKEAAGAFQTKSWLMRFLCNVVTILNYANKHKEISQSFSKFRSSLIDLQCFPQNFISLRFTTIFGFLTTYILSHTLRISSSK